MAHPTSRNTLIIGVVELSDTIPRSAQGFRTRLKERLSRPADSVIEELLGGTLTLLYLSATTDRSLLNGHLMEPLAQLPTNEKQSWDSTLAVSAASGRKERREITDAVHDLLDGRSLLHLAASTVLYSFNTRVAITRPPSDPAGERTLRRPRVSLVESLDDNTALIHQNIRASRLRVEAMLLGRDTRTRLHIFYINEVANPRLLTAVRERSNGGFFVALKWWLEQGLDQDTGMCLPHEKGFGGGFGANIEICG